MKSFSYLSLLILITLPFVLSKNITKADILVNETDTSGQSIPALKVTALHYSGGSSFFVGSLDFNVYESDLFTGNIIRTFSYHTAGIRSIVSSGEFLFTAGADKQIIKWRISNANVVTKFIDPALGTRAHQGFVTSVLVSGTYLFSAGAEGLVKQWDTDTGNLIGTFSGHKAIATSLLVKEDRLYSSSWDGKVIQWNINTKQAEKEFSNGPYDPAAPNPIWSFTVIGDSLYTASDSWQITRWSIADQEIKGYLGGHSGPVWTLYSDGTNIYSSSKDANVIRWKANEDAVDAIYRGQSDASNTLFTTDKVLYAAGLGNEIKKWALTANVEFYKGQ